MANIDFTPAALGRGAIRGNVLPFRVPTSKKVPLYRGTDVDVRPLASAPVTHLDEVRDDSVLLAKEAPWMKDEPSIVEQWLGSTFMLHVDRRVKKATGKSIIADIDWKAGDFHEIKGTILTRVGNVIVKAYHNSHGGHATFTGHRDALLNVGVAQLEWLHTESRQGRRNDFYAVVFGAERKLNVTRSGERYCVRLDLTGEESEEVNPESLDVWQKARTEAEAAVNELPSAPTHYLEHFRRRSELFVDVLENLASKTMGGYSLADGSRTELLIQLNGLRQIIDRAASSYSFSARQRDIADIAHKFAPSNK